MNMEVGSLASNPNKIRLVEIIAKKDQKIDEIAKKVRIPSQTLKNLLNELLNDGLVSREGEVYRISEKGIRAIKEIREDAGGKRR